MLGRAADSGAVTIANATSPPPLYRIDSTKTFLSCRRALAGLELQ